MKRFDASASSSPSSSTQGGSSPESSTTSKQTARRPAARQTSKPIRRVNVAAPSSPPSASSEDAASSASAAAAEPNTSNRCPICAKTFQYGNDLRKHMRIHTDERPYACSACDQRFRQAGCLKNHVASQHATRTQPTFSCHYCAKAFPIKERLRLHMRIHSGVKPYGCARCGRAFSRGGQLKQHMITHGECRESFLAEGGGGGGRKKQVAEAEGKAKAVKVEGSGGGERSDRLSCGACGASFMRALLLKKHIRQCDQKQRNADSSGGQSTKAAAANRQPTFDCDICDSSFGQHSQLRVHKRMHSGERPYKCQVCYHSFAHSSVLKLHIRKHTGEKPFKCPICTDPTAFSQLPHLKTHMRTIHGMDKTYQCPTCTDFYKTKNELLLHSARCQQQKKQELEQPDEQTSQPSTDSQPAFADDIEAAASNLQLRQQTEKLSHMRLCVAVLLKRISTAERLKQLGYEKVLIDNVIMTALKRAGQPYEPDDRRRLSELERFSANVRYFLEWTIPKTTLERFEHKETNVKELLVKLTQQNQ